VLEASRVMGNLKRDLKIEVDLRLVSILGILRFLRSS
jgi:hypothetical protein